MLKILYCASECVPFVKTGGLADVAGSLPAALNSLGADVRVILPKYRIIDEYWKSRMEHVCDFFMLFGWENVFVGVEKVVDGAVTYYFIDNEDFFSADSLYGGGIDEGYRFAFFSRAILEALPRIPFFPDLLHANDWQTGLVPALLAAQYQWSRDYAAIKTVLSIHNLRYQGVFDYAAMNGKLGFDAKYFTPGYLEFYGCLNCLKAGLVFSDQILTVSPSYAEEIKTAYYGEQLDGLLRARTDRLAGIVNGIDTLVFDPGTDRFLTVHYNAEDLRGKRECKKLLQAECGWESAPDTPLIGMIARLSAQKGLDLVERVLADILRQDVQMVFLGTGDKHFTDFLNWAEWRYPDRVCFRTGLDEGLAHRIYAGCDMFLMPSQFEPCGLSQLIAQRYGTAPIVRETGGLIDTVTPYNQYTGEGDGFSFANYNAHEMLFTIERAIALYKTQPEAWAGIVRAGMVKELGWTASAKQYMAVYERLTEPALEACAAPPTLDPAPAAAEPAPVQARKRPPRQAAEQAGAEAVPAAEQARKSPVRQAAEQAGAEAAEPPKAQPHVRDAKSRPKRRK